MRTRVLLFLALAWNGIFVIPAGAEDNYVKAQVDRYLVDRGDEIVYTVEIMNAGEKQFTPDVTLPDFYRDFQIGNVYTRSSVNILNGKTHIITFKEVHLVVRSPGEVTIPPARVSMVSPDTGERFSLESNKVTISVNDTTGQKAQPTPTPEIDVLRPIKRGAKVTVTQWLPFVVVGTILAVVFGVSYYMKHRPPPKPVEPQKPIDPRTPEKRAMDSIEEILHLKAEGKFNEFYTALSAILRRYMSEEYQFQAEEATTREMIQNMEAMRFKPEFLATYRKYFLESDQVKFANITPPVEELETVAPRTKQLILEQDKREIPEPPPPEPVPEVETGTADAPEGSGQSQVAAATGEKPPESP